MKKTVQDIAYEHYKLPNFIVNIGISIINSSIQERINADIFEKLSPFSSSSACTTPALFIAATEDGLVRPKRVLQLFQQYGSGVRGAVIKSFKECGGGHNGFRDQDLIEQCFQFLLTEFQKYVAARDRIDQRLYDMTKYRRLKWSGGRLEILLQPIQEPPSLDISPFHGNIAISSSLRPFGVYSKHIAASRLSSLKPRSKKEEDRRSASNSFQHLVDHSNLFQVKKSSMLRSITAKDSLSEKENLCIPISPLPIEPEANRPPPTTSKLHHQKRLLSQIVDTTGVAPLGKHSPYSKQPQHKNRSMIHYNFAGNTSSHNASANLRFAQDSPDQGHSFQNHFNSNPTNQVQNRLRGLNFISQIKPRTVALPSGKTPSQKSLPYSSSLKTFDEKPFAHKNLLEFPVQKGAPVSNSNFTDSLNTTMNLPTECRVSNSHQSNNNLFQASFKYNEENFHNESMIEEVQFVGSYLQIDESRRLY